MDKGLKPKIDLIKEYLTGRKEVLCAYSFGSFALGRGNRFSDLDLAILFDPIVTQADYARKQIRLMNDLGDLLDMPVDLIILNRTSSFLKFQVIQKGRRIYERKDRKSRSFEARSLTEYFDFAPVKNFLEKNLIRRLKEA